MMNFMLKIVVAFYGKAIFCKEMIVPSKKIFWVFVIEVIIRAIFLFYSDWYFSEFPRLFPLFFSPLSF